jgi:hypothetical protein
MKTGCLFSLLFSLLFWAIIFAVICSISVYSADIVQIATTLDSTGHCNNWTILTVTWDTIIYTDVPDHIPTSTKSLQTWMFPIDNGYLKATFIRSVGIYWIRWSRDGVIFSEPNSIEVRRPATPRGN